MFELEHIIKFLSILLYIGFIISSITGFMYVVDNNNIMTYNHKSINKLGNIFNSLFTKKIPDYKNYINQEIDTIDNTYNFNTKNGYESIDFYKIKLT